MMKTISEGYIIKCTIKGEDVYVSPTTNSFYTFKANAERAINAQYYKNKNARIVKVKLIEVDEEEQ